MRKFNWFYPIPILLALLTLVFSAFLFFPNMIGKAILMGLLPMCILAIGMGYIMNRRLQNAQKQLQQIINTLEKFDVDEPQKIAFKKSSFNLFNDLNENILELIDRIRSNFQANKQFTQNASHELQTPLAIIKGHVELLLNSPHLKEKEIASLGVILQNTNRLARLNKDLILLSKIEHHRYSDFEKVDIGVVIEEILGNFKDLLLLQEIDIKKNITNTFEVNMSATLAEILFANLFQNAIRYNVENGFISVQIIDQTVTIANSGEVLEVSTDTLFKRFKRQSTIEESLGLGLSIVKSICDLYNIEVNYVHQHGLHQLVLIFP